MSARIYPGLNPSDPPLVRDDANNVYEIDLSTVGSQGTRGVLFCNPVALQPQPVQAPSRGGFSIDNWGVTVPGAGLDNNGNAQWRGTAADLLADPGAVARMVQLFPALDGDGAPVLDGAGNPTAQPRVIATVDGAAPADGAEIVINAGTQVYTAAA